MEYTGDVDSEFKDGREDELCLFMKKPTSQTINIIASTGTDLRKSRLKSRINIFPIYTYGISKKVQIFVLTRRLAGLYDQY